MEHDHEHYHKPDDKENKWLKKDRIITILFLIFIGFYLITEHRAHLFAALPWLIFAICPIMHIFMHHGHKGHNNNDKREGK